MKQQKRKKSAIFGKNLQIHLIISLLKKTKRKPSRILKALLSIN